jgi:acetyl coenzyme A synthetase (ADP forming)-like protein
MSLVAAFSPKSIAIIGASHDKGSVGNDLVKNLIESKFKGRIYPVNPKGGMLYGLPVCRLISEIKGDLDLVVIAVPAVIVPQVLHEAAFKHVKAAVVISAGFKEIGNHHLEQEIADICRKHKITLIGPNCLGIQNPTAKLNASFASSMPSAGPLAFVSQSGAICSSVLDYAQERGLGFSKFMSIGNKALLDEATILKFLYRDPQTKVILMYLEDVTNVKALLEAAFKVTHGRVSKPIIVLKSGSTAAGSQASRSHTGALAGSDAAYEALFAQSGMMRAESMSELFDLAECFAYNKVLSSKHVAVITNAGGPGVLTTDSIVEEGLQLAQLSEKTIATLKEALPKAANVHNPVDVLGDADADRYHVALQTVIKDPAVGGALVLLTPQTMTEVKQTAQAIIKVKKTTQKPIVVSFMGEAAVEPGLDLLHRAGVATTLFPEPAARVLSRLHDFHVWLQPQNRSTFRFSDINKEQVAKIITAYQGKKSGTFLSADDVVRVLRAYGFPLIKRKLVTTESELGELRGFPNKVVLKIVSPDIIHKTEVGGVVLDVPKEQVSTEYKALLQRVKKKYPSAEITGVEVMEMVGSDGFELILGITTDPALGKLVMVGWGGIYAEVIKDTRWGLAPLNQEDAKRMIHELEAFQIIKGFRGKPPLDKAYLIRVLGRLSQLVMDFPQIKELDINPLLLKKNGSGASVLDARIALE